MNRNNRLPFIVTVAGALSLLLSIRAFADQPWACQYEKSAGLRWEQDEWRTTTFKSEPKFILVQNKANLTVESASKAAFDGYTDLVRCFDFPKGYIVCDDGFTKLVFNPKNGRGGVINLFGALLTSKKPDDLTVDAFSCEKY